MKFIYSSSGMDQQSRRVFKLKEILIIFMCTSNVYIVLVPLLYQTRMSENAVKFRINFRRHYGRNTADSQYGRQRSQQLPKYKRFRRQSNNVAGNVEPYRSHVERKYRITVVNGRRVPYDRRYVPSGRRHLPNCL